MARKKGRRGWQEGGIEQLPSGSWRAEVQHGTDPATGKRVRVKRTFRTKAEALDWLAARRAERAAGTAPTALTVGAWAAEWLRVVRETRERATWAFYRKRAERFIEPPPLGAVRLADLTTRAVEGWLAGLPTTPGEKHRSLKTLKRCLAAAADRGLVARNVAAPVDPPRGRRRPPRFWTAAQARAFLAAADADRYAAYWRLALDAGMRPGELLGLHWPDFDGAAGTVRVSRSYEELPGEPPQEKPPKTARGVRAVPLAPSTVAAVARHRDAERAAGRGGDGPVFWGEKGDRLGRGWLADRHFPRLCRAAGVPRIGLYDLRHTSATLLLSAGVSLRVVADRLGHESPDVTLRHYVFAIPAEADAARHVAERLFGPAAAAH